MFCKHSREKSEQVLFTSIVFLSKVKINGNSISLYLKKYEKYVYCIYIMKRILILQCLKNQFADKRL